MKDRAVWSLHRFENNIEEVRIEEASRLGDEAHHSALFFLVVWSASLILAQAPTPNIFVGSPLPRKLET